MYYEHFGLKENPFHPTPDPRYLYLSQGHQEALDHLVYGINERKGFVMITGGVGTGKTTLLRSLLADLDKSVKTALILNPFVSEEDLLPTICGEFGIEAPDCAGKKNYLDVINTFLLDTFAAGHTAVVLLDEAQNLSRDVLEQVRILSNLETDREKLLQIVLVGQEELNHILGLEDLRQLNERIVVRYNLPALDNEDVKAYVHHRMMIAGCKGRSPFSSGALKALYAKSRGVPRRINAICDRALLAAYSKGQKQVYKAGIVRAVSEVTGTSPEPGTNRRLAFFHVFLACVFVAALCLGLGYYFWHSPENDLDIQIAKSGPIMAADNVRVSEIAPEIPVPAPQKAPEPNAAPFVPELEKTPLADNGPILDDEKSLARLFSLYCDDPRLAAVVGPSQPGIVSFRTDVEHVRKFLRPFRAGFFAKDNGPDGHVVVTRVTATGFLVSSLEKYQKEISTQEFEADFSGALVWLIPEKLWASRVYAGMQGPLVQWVQETLDSAGYNLVMDGVYGPRTARAVRFFQKDFGIRADGVAGPSTIRLLYQISQPVKQGDYK